MFCRVVARAWLKCACLKWSGLKRSPPRAARLVLSAPDSSPCSASRASTSTIAIQVSASANHCPVSTRGGGGGGGGARSSSVPMHCVRKAVPCSKSTLPELDPGIFRRNTLQTSFPYAGSVGIPFRADCYLGKGAVAGQLKPNKDNKKNVQEEVGEAQKIRNERVLLSLIELALCFEKRNVA